MITWKRTNEGLISADGRFKAEKSYRRSYPYALHDTLTNRHELFDYMWEAKNFAEYLLTKTNA